MLKAVFSKLIPPRAAPPADESRRSVLCGLIGGLLGGLIAPKAAAAQTAGAACAAGEIGTLRRGTGADANRLLFCTDASMGTGGGMGAASWINFNGTSTPVVRSSFNISSLTKNGTGDWTYSFAVMSDANFSASGMCDVYGSSPKVVEQERTAASHRVRCGPYSGGWIDATQMNATTFR